MTIDLLGPIAYGSFFLVMALLNGVVCRGLNVQWGQTGLINVGVADFVAIGVLLATMIVSRPGGLIGERALVSRHVVDAETSS